MKFKKGDDVVCIYNILHTDILTIGKTYKVLLSYYGNVTEREHIRVQRDDEIWYIDLFSSNFLLLNDFKKIKRKEKLNRLNLL